MNNDWAQVTYGNGDIELFNTDNLAYLLKHTSGLRKIGFTNGNDPVLLDPADSVISKTQQQVETFFGSSFVKLFLDDTTLFVPIKSLVSIKKVGSVITVRMQQDFAEANGTLTAIDENEIATEFGAS